MNNKYKFLFALKIVAGIAFFVILFGFGTMYLWNWLVPSLFHGPVISFGQSIGLLILSRVLFGGFGRKFGRGGHCGHQGGWGGHYWKRRMHERFSNMMPEEKEKLKQRFKDKCSHWHGMEEDNTKNNL